MCSDNEEILNPWDHAQKIFDESHPSVHTLSAEEKIAQVASCNEENIETTREKARREFYEALKPYTPSEQEFLRDRIQTFTPDSDFGHPSMNIDPAELPIKNDKIIPTPPLAKRRYSQKDEMVIDNFIEVSLKSGLIMPIQSPTSSALHVVYKNGKPRVVSDLRAVNNLNAGDFQFIFPRPTEKIRELVGKGYKYFTQLDLSGAFTQIPIHRNSYPLLAFTAMTKKHTGTFAYKYLNFGYKASPAVFSSILDNILYKINSADCEGTVINYFDDICVGSATYEEHCKILKRLFARFMKYNVKLNLSKSKFWKDHCEFCSYRIDEEGYRMSDDRLKLLREYPDYDVRDRRKNSDLKILGFFNYHRNFVQNYASMEREIRSIIKDFKLDKIDPNDANKRIKEIIDKIKEKVAETSLECIPDDTEAFLQTDASGHSWGYTLFTKKGVVRYGGGSFTASVQRSHSIFEKELKAIALAIKECFHLINGAAKIIIMCDNLAAVFSSTAAKTKRPITATTIKYLTLIQTYTSGLDSSIVHIGTSKNLIADALSRMTYDEHGNFDLEATKDQLNHRKGEEEAETPIQQVNAISGEDMNLQSNISELLEQTEDQISQKINKNVRFAAAVTHARDLPDTEMVELTPDQEYAYAKKLHESTHWSSSKTMYTLLSLGYRVSGKVLNKVQTECESCGKYKRLAPRAKLNPRAVEFTEPLAEIHLDHVQMKNTFEGHKYFVSVICDSSRMLFAKAVKNKTVLPVIDYLEDIMLISSRDIKAINLDNGIDSNFLRDWAASKNIELRFRPAGISRGILVERSHSSIRKKLDVFTSEYKSEWHFELHDVIKSLNTQIHDVTGYQPAFLFSGNKYLPGFGIQNEEAEEMTFHRRVAVKLINESKQERASKITYRVLPANQPIIVRHNHEKNGKTYEAVSISDAGAGTSCIVAKLSISGRILKIHKSDIYIRKLDENFEKIFGTQNSTNNEVQLTE